LNEQGKVKTVNPPTEEVLNEYQIMTKQQQINDKARKARNAFDEWKKIMIKECRVAMVGSLKNVIR
jgi:acyl-CoA reductase-like NAD-dependent aldehyde dehydrogenase